ncbi:Chaperone SurA [Rhodopseudomonas palustris]|uniref:Parvulin-like PPIase n=1 Tax=Rhodopseudomonas palustris (strain ATCC BAA-98 / CGA009) TaxID=258594 RepID=Q6NA30_RHOPA|nr:peptidylprolyl isomerase [Rhodopseudomonas palustris]OPF91392.1 peptidylprolyl isomerase [Rhodopseudomonas palustris]QQM02852.1 Chaperone SurA [Rhodopseudomonas palustris]RJF60447.1 peptidylprolyl isomerase [Rhodopseudomonas palustris]WAB79029.1 peptidylprolyl isomerase [Rhodopseudomonas palustris]WCL91491.1 peptidylprolyl isomerase [Rhodopseudomonas palustris CGA009]
MSISIVDCLRRPVLVAVATLVPMVAVAQTAPPPQRLLPPQPQSQAAPRAPKPQAATTALAPAAPKAKASDDTKDGDVIARVGSTNISTEEIRGYIAALGERDRAALRQDPNLLSQAVRMMLANRLVTQEIAAKKWDQQPSVAEKLERVRESAAVELYLQSVSTPPEKFPSDEDLQKVYEANRAAFAMPRQFELAQIYVPLSRDADKAAEDAARKSVDDIQRKLKAPGADFSAIASEAGDANAGALGWVVENQIRPEIRTKVMELAKNAISEPIKLDDGWHFIKVLDTKAPYTRTLPEVRDGLVQQIRSERSAALRRAYLAELLKQQPPVINELALAGLLNERSPTAR